MGDWFYEGYKRRLAATEKRKEELRGGKIGLLGGSALVVAALFMIPYHAVKSSEISGRELQAGDACYMEQLEIRDVRVDDDGDIYCVAAFRDMNEKEWIISFHPGDDDHLIRRMEIGASLGTFSDIKIDGYVYLYQLTGNSETYYSLRSKKYAESDGSNIIRLDADYLCDIYGNYTLEVLLRPSEAKRAFFVGGFGMIHGIFLLLRNLKKREV